MKPGYLKFIKGFLDELNSRGISTIGQVERAGSKPSRKSCNSASLAKSKKVLKELERTKGAVGISHYSSLDEIKAIVDIWNGLNKRQKSQWMNKRRGDSWPCIIRMVNKYINKSENVQVYSNRKVSVKKSRAQSNSLQKYPVNMQTQSNHNNNSAKPNHVKKRQSKKLSSPNVKDKRVEKPLASERVLTLTSKNPSSRNNSLNSSIKSTKPRNTKIVRKRTNSAALPSTVYKKENKCGKRTKLSTNSKTNIKSITATKKFKSTFGESNCKDLNAKTKLRYKKYCAKPPTSTTKYLPVVVLKESIPSRGIKRKNESKKMAVSKKRKYQTNHKDDNNNGSENHNNVSNNVLKKRHFLRKNTSAESTKQKNIHRLNSGRSRTSIPKYPRGREPRYFK